MRIRCPLLLIIVFCSLSLMTKADSPKLRWNKTKQIIEVRGIPTAQLKKLSTKKPSSEQWQSILSVYVDKGRLPTDDDQPIFGSYRVHEGKIIFKPRYPFIAGNRYIAKYAPTDSTTRFQINTVGKVEAPTITKVFPSSDQLPENLLKFYIYFSKPMAQGRAFQHIHLLDDKGKKIESAFLGGDELWNANGDRFTVFFDPGRIKKEVLPRELFGPPLEHGKTFTLLIESNWTDAKGKALKKEYRKTFKVIEPDADCPDIDKWSIEPPSAKSTQPIKIRFNEPLDYALLQRMISLIDPEGGTIEGTIRVHKQETVWELTPTRPWKSGQYTLKVNSKLEDRAGNSIAEPFEIDLRQDVRQPKKPEVVQRKFMVRPSPEK